MAQVGKREENSLLVSLKELKGIEQDRVQQEAEDARRREEDARAAREAEIRRAREAEEARVRAAAEAERQRIEDEQRRVRDDALRLEEAERKHRVEAQMKLEEQRLKMEIEANAIHGAKKKPVALIAASVVLVFAVVGLGIFAYQKHQENERKQAELADAQLKQDQLKKEMKATQDNIDGLVAQEKALDARKDATIKQLTDAKTAEDQKRANDELKRIEDERNRLNAELEKQKGKLNGMGGTGTSAATGTPKPAKPPILVCPKKKPLCPPEERIPVGSEE